MLACRFTVLYCLSGLITLIACPVNANWQPEPEPISWSRLRKSHLPGEGWSFVDSISNPQLQAAEYLRSPRVTTSPSDGVVVEIEAGLLLKRADQSDWSAKVIPMRAVCDAGRMDRQDLSGTWKMYPARPDTPVKVAWMCSLL
ncbi:MAG: hypothetical protein CL831_09050 [Crocinitomicaceae bacterium]|nr:hypothetical protein [Crocinitomicaceae bacterium]